MQTNIKIENVILEVKAEGYPTAKIQSVLDYDYKTVEDILAEVLGDYKELSTITICIETQKSNTIQISQV